MSVSLCRCVTVFGKVLAVAMNVAGERNRWGPCASILSSSSFFFSKKIEKVANINLNDRTNTYTSSIYPHESTGAVCSACLRCMASKSITHVNILGGCAAQPRRGHVAGMKLVIISLF